MKRYFFLALVVLAQTLCAQTIEPNLKWGKPTEQELKMTEYLKMEVKGDKIHIHNRLLMKSGSFPKSQFPQLADFIRTINNIYNQKVVLKKKEL